MLFYFILILRCFFWARDLLLLINANYDCDEVSDEVNGAL